VKITKTYINKGRKPRYNVSTADFRGMDLLVPVEIFEIK